MKKLQTAVLSIVLAVLLAGVPLSSRAASGPIVRADSLFRLKQYTQSWELYNALFQNHYYSPSMLLKMAFIQEGLGHVGQSMYYLNLYFLATHDPQALVKIEEMAARNKLEGYGDTDAARLWTIMKENHSQILGALLSACVFLFALVLYQKLRLHRRPIATAIILYFCLALLFTQSYLVRYKEQGIVASPSTYLMTGPSAGSSVLAIVGEGHRVEILGKKDVWLRVKWGEGEVFVKEDAVLPISL